MKATVVSLFAGCGGSSLGYHQAGFDVRLAVEFNQKAVANYRANFPGTAIWDDDIANLSGDDALWLSRITAGSLSILDGSPPCQGFSTAGTRHYDDPRNGLFSHFVRLVSAFQPQVFVMENVSGLRKGKMRLAFAEIHKALKATGYRVSCRELNAWWYGVPQDRRRLIWIGMRDDLDIEPSHPMPTCQKPVTVQVAIGHLPIGSAEKHAPQIVAAWHKSKPGQLLRKTVSHVGSFQSTRLDPNRPSTTQLKSVRNWHWQIPRYITLKEAAILHGFPETFQWVGSKATARALIGDSVPPPMTEAIGRHILGLLSTEAMPA